MKKLIFLQTVHSVIASIWKYLSPKAFCLLGGSIFFLELQLVLEENDLTLEV